ncbi:MAG: ribosomal protein L3 N(5)-glutamine methyltransferase [Gammaproteobacteria bacterium RIFCSPHIGHO2_12_FULL_37_34]|nr:MAG: ribosomal protein L3 N(5)-glutamine methyltransferase [Gammaproteobacteria bacterium RIFCSPHIGHO2_12_FULL_37_34]
MIKHPELTTIRDYMRYATSSFNEAGLYFGHGTDNAWDEATALVLHTLHLPHHIHPTVLDAHLTKDEQIKLMQLINERVAKRIPLAYLTHEAWFAGLAFYVDERVLIPRSSIAELIQKHFQPWLGASEPQTILDLCTGSGCIAIACAKAFEHAKIDASDISHDALTVAKINILRHEVEEQVHLFESDLFSSLPPQKYDLIISNPPYVSAYEMSTLPPEYLHEPKLGLLAGEEGLDFAKRILQASPAYLKPNGILIIEVGNNDIALGKQFPDIPFTWIEFDHGEGGVLMLTAEQLHAHQV